MMSRYVLLVDDSPMFRREAEGMLSAHGYTVVEASDGAHALCILRDRPREFDLLLCSVEIPSMYGAQLFAEVAAQRP